MAEGRVRSSYDKSRVAVAAQVWLLVCEYRCWACGHELRMGGDDTKAKLLAHHGAGLIQPQSQECLPQPEFLAWHRSGVFKEPARE